MSYKDGYGLREFPKDGTEYNVGAFVQLSKPSRSFKIDITKVLTQVTDTCAKEASQSLMSYINGTPLNTLLPWVVGRSNAGYEIEDYGIDIKTMLLACVKVGALPMEDSPYDSDDDRSVFADITKWDLKTLLPKAIVYKAGSAVFVEPTNGMDMVDSVRATMEKLKAPMLIGIRWNFDPMNPKVDNFSDTGYGHALLITGWDDDKWEGYMLTLNSWGVAVGDKGFFYFSRAMLNHDLAIFGAGTLIDETAERVKWHIENKIYLNDGNWLLNIARAFINALKGLISKPVIGVPPYPIKVVKMCEAIRWHEGWFPGSRSRRNHNPGNFKYVGQYSAIGKDAQGFAIFPSDEVGWNHLLKVVYNACAGKSLAYKPEMTLYEYFAKYAPSHDKNDPKRYSEVVAEYIGVSPSVQIKSLII